MSKDEIYEKIIKVLNDDNTKIKYASYGLYFVYFNNKTMCFNVHPTYILVNSLCDTDRYGTKFNRITEYKKYKKLKRLVKHNHKKKIRKSTNLETILKEI